jgi:hypothetical protein
MAGVLDGLLIKDRSGGYEGDGAGGAIGGGNGPRVGDAQPPAENKEAVQRDQGREPHGDKQHQRHLRIGTGPAEFKAPLEADGEEQVERQQFGNRMGDA